MTFNPPPLRSLLRLPNVAAAHFANSESPNLQLREFGFSGGCLRAELDEGSEFSGGKAPAEVRPALPAGRREEEVEKMRRCVKSEL